MLVGLGRMLELLAHHRFSITVPVDVCHSEARGRWPPPINHGEIRGVVSTSNFQASRNLACSWLETMGGYLCARFRTRAAATRGPCSLPETRGVELRKFLGHIELIIIKII